MSDNKMCGECRGYGVIQYGEDIAPTTCPECRGIGITADELKSRLDAVERGEFLTHEKAMASLLPIQERQGDE